MEITNLALMGESNPAPMLKYCHTPFSFHSERYQVFNLAPIIGITDAKNCRAFINTTYNSNKRNIDIAVLWKFSTKQEHQKRLLRRRPENFLAKNRAPKYC
uniref:Uncharacterized protein n=1 Tax=Romanomermis culicivorax TaxID=13658 RepID=A0A915L5P9_ROMCU